MKANKLFFFSLASLLAAQSLAPDYIVKVESSRGRMPASTSKAAPKKKVVKKAVKKPITAKEMQTLKDKLSKIEADLKKKETLLDEKNKELELLKNNKTEEKVDALTKLITEQKSEIDKLKTDIQNSEVKEAKELELIICKAELKGEKLEADVKKALADKEEVLSKIEELKKDNSDLKVKIAEDKKGENPELISLMSQMTSMFTTQMQAQMQMQMQMMSLISQMQMNMAPQYNPYSPMLYPTSSFGFPSLNDSIGFIGSNVGLAQQPSPWSNFANPYSMLPDLERRELPSQPGFSFNPNPAVTELERQHLPSQTGFTFNPRGFDFSQPQMPQAPAAPMAPEEPAKKMLPVIVKA